MTIHNIPEVKQELWNYNQILCTVFLWFPHFGVLFFLLIFTSGYILHSKKQPSL